MILDRLENAGRYEQSHKGFKEAFDFLRSAKLSSLDAGRHPVDGDRVFVVIVRDPGRGRSGAKLEIHRKYIDIQLVIAGQEEIGWKPAAACTQPDGQFDTTKDLGFFRDQSALWLPMPPATFAVFFPEDAHAPLGGEGTLHKAIAKVLVD
ncbi:MAG TPA: YhcH/YjgK/YiaL family protein [Phycisphaerae bacterium]|nr:YhcH/YjgK/YiaL family protein [Phycisphaerae bacterium]